MNKYAVTERFVLHVGYSCNERCDFCYYVKNLKEGKIKDWTTEENKRRIDFAKKFNKKAIDFSGGEPTIRKDLLELIKYCKSNDFTTINIITNGIKTADYLYCKELVDAGLTEVLFSIHSHKAEIHDKLTHVQGSFDKIMLSIDNFKKLGIPIRVNTVVNNENYMFINEFLEMANKYDPLTVSLIVFNPSETASQIKKDDEIRFSDYKIIGDSISAALDNWKDKFKTLNVRFLPFCFLKKHPDCIRTQWQKFHEDQEWDPFLNVTLQKGLFISVCATIIGFFLNFNVPKFVSADNFTFLNKCLSAFRMKYFYRQNKMCKKCALNSICTGIQRDYVKKFGYPEFEPIIEKSKIYDPLFYAKNKKEIFKSLR